MKKFILLTLISFILVSCNPMMHVVGSGMRKMNIKQNKYSAKKPYVKHKKYYRYESESELESD